MAIHKTSSSDSQSCVWPSTELAFTSTVFSRSNRSNSSWLASGPAHSESNSRATAGGTPARLVHSVPSTQNVLVWATLDSMSSSAKLSTRVAPTINALMLPAVVLFILPVPPKDSDRHNLPTQRCAALPGTLGTWQGSLRRRPKQHSRQRIRKRWQEDAIDKVPNQRPAGNASGHDQTEYTAIDQSKFKNEDEFQFTTTNINAGSTVDPKRKMQYGTSPCSRREPSDKVVFFVASLHGLE